MSYSDEDFKKFQQDIDKIAAKVSELLKKARALRGLLEDGEDIYD
jgi:hypothetical protein